MTERELRRIFDEDADTYERARPGYPDELIGDLVELTGLGPGRSVIEIGPGTGQATRHLLAAGAEVTAVELGPHLAARLRTRLGGTGLRVVEGAFECWEPPHRVDLIAAFTSWPEHADRRALRRLDHEDVPVRAPRRVSSRGLVVECPGSGGSHLGRVRRAARTTHRGER